MTVNESEKKKKKWKQESNIFEIQQPINRVILMSRKITKNGRGYCTDKR